MADRFDDGRDGLSGAEPSRDLWAEAQGRATHQTVALSTVPGARRRHPGRWLAVAALVALVVGVGLAVVTDDDPGVTAGPEGSSVTAPSPTYGAGTMCPFTVTGEPPQLRTGHVPGETFEGVDHGFNPHPTVMHGTLGDQPMEVSIPGQGVTDLVGERVEDIELERGTAQLWLSDGFAQVRWFPGTDGPCDSLTVTVFGPDDDFNRHAATDFADRVVLDPAPSADGSTATTVPDTSTSTTVSGPATWPIQGQWDLYSVRATDQTEYPTGLTVVFAGTDVTWSDGCNDYTGTVERLDGTHLNVADGTVSGTAKPCPGNQTTRVLAAVIGSTRVTARLEGAAGSIYLDLSTDSGDYELVLRRTNDGSSPSGDAPLG